MLFSTSARRGWLKVNSYDSNPRYRCNDNVSACLRTQRLSIEQKRKVPLTNCGGIGVRNVQSCDRGRGTQRKAYLESFCTTKHAVPGVELTIWQLEGNPKSSRDIACIG